ncbi:MAG: hypothetical protein CMK59_00060 [Proteobacteria bacterium]|nr:hypothetical protein [Pseudomonadota bacterium]
MILLSVLDGFLTVLWVHGGIATEANPLLADILDRRVGIFWLGKTILVGFGAVLLSRYRHQHIARLGLALSLLVYGAIAIEHLRIATLVLWHLNDVPVYMSSGLANL